MERGYKVEESIEAFDEADLRVRYLVLPFREFAGIDAVDATLCADVRKLRGPMMTTRASTQISIPLRLPDHTQSSHWTLSG